MEFLTSVVWLIYANILHGIQWNNFFSMVNIWKYLHDIKWNLAYCIQYCGMVYNISVNILGNILLCIPYNIRNKIS